MYETNKPSTLINDTRWLLHFGSWGRVRSAMPNRPFSLSPFAYKVDVQIFGRIPDCFGWLRSMCDWNFGFPTDFFSSTSTSLRRQIRCCALATTMSWFYELIDRQLAAETVAQAQRRLVRRKLVNTTARSWRCRPPSLAPNSVLVSRSARSPSSLGAIGKKTPATQF